MTPGLSYCCDCHPGGPIEPPPCRRCGSVGNYYSAGLCTRCHRFAPSPIESCSDCHAWGVTRTNGWLCRACIGWRQQYPTPGLCPVCAQRRHLGRGGYCRLCWRTAATHHRANRRIGTTYIPADVPAANRWGQQLFLADLMGPQTRRRTCPRRPVPGKLPAAQARQATGTWFRQLLLFDNNPPSWAARHAIPPPRDQASASALHTLAADLGEQRGWSRSSQRRLKLGLAALLGWQSAPDEPIRASDIARLNELGVQCAHLLEAVLTEAGLFLDDRAPAIQQWIARNTEGLPAPMSEEVHLWFCVLREGSTTAPRYRPRHETTVRLQVRHALPALRAWAAAGHTSLREISRDDVTAVLPPSGNPRALMGAALRSMFRVLKGRRVVFTNPITHITTGAPERREPLPADLDALRSALHGEDPAAAAMAALLGFHGIRSGQMRRLTLTDIRDGKLHIDTRVIPLADPVRERLAAWLDHRARRWPRTVNPHLFIHQRTAAHTDSVGTRWPALRMGMSVRAIRDDRILHEAHATAGDVRRLVDLFGITVKTATRYTRTVDHPSLVP